MLTGCQQSENIDFVDENLPLAIEASIGGAEKLASRYVGDAPNDVAFGENDQIGVALQGGSFVKWTLDKEGHWIQDGNSMTWKDKISDHVFYAFYPYCVNATLSNVPMPPLANQKGTMESVAACDFLVTSKKQKYENGGVVSFTEDESFQHVSSLIALTLKNAGDLVSATINGISLNGTDIVTPTNYSFLAESEGSKVTLDDDNSDDDLQVTLADAESLMGDKNPKTLYFIINSGTVNPSEVTLSIAYTSANGDKCQASLTGLKKDNDYLFERGKQYNYGITVSDRVLTITGGVISDWTEGVSIGDFTINGEKKEENNEN